MGANGEMTMASVLRDRPQLTERGQAEAEFCDHLLGPLSTVA